MVCTWKTSDLLLLLSARESMSNYYCITKFHHPLRASLIVEGQEKCLNSSLTVALNMLLLSRAWIPKLPLTFLLVHHLQVPEHTIKPSRLILLLWWFFPLLLCFISSFQRQAKYSENKLKCTKARNDYLLNLAATNAVVAKYYIHDVSDMIDVSTDATHMFVYICQLGILMFIWKCSVALWLSPSVPASHPLTGC